CSIETLPRQLGIRRLTAEAYVLEVVKSGEVLNLARRLPAVGLQDRQQVANAVGAGRAQYGGAVVDKQRARGIERLQFPQLCPEIEVFLGHAEVMGGHQTVEILIELGNGQLEIQALAMGVGDEDDPVMAVAQLTQKILDVGPKRNQVLNLFLELADIEAEFAGPVVEAVPVERALFPFDALRQLRLDLFQGAIVMGRVAQGQMLQPEVIVEVEIQQGTVHIQQDGIDLAPVDHG